MLAVDTSGLLEFVDVLDPRLLGWWNKLRALPGFIYIGR
jgi:hypothetical protein